MLSRSLSGGLRSEIVWVVQVGSYLGEQGGPDGLDIGDTGSLDQGLELVGLYGMLLVKD